MASRNTTPKPGRYWIGTVPVTGTDWSTEKFAELLSGDHGIKWIRGQQELGASGYRHWQLVVGFSASAR